MIINGATDKGVQLFPRRLDVSSSATAHPAWRLVDTFLVDPSVPLPDASALAHQIVADVLASTTTGTAGSNGTVRVAEWP